MCGRTFPSYFVPKKSLGQNFLVDKRSLDRIVSHAEISPEETVLEVGPGLGTLTEFLQAKARKVIAIEKDPKLIELLYRRFANNPKVEIIHGDILKTDLPYCDKVVATPPYNISSKLLFVLLKGNFRVIVLTLQKEFAERLIAKPGTSNYGRLTVMINHSAYPEILDHISREAFRPKPKVDSAIVRITLHYLKKRLDEVVFTDLVRGLFTQRRRNLRSSLRHYFDQRGRSLPKELTDSEIPEKRVYQVSLEEFEILAQRLTPMLAPQ